MSRPASAGVIGSLSCRRLTSRWSRPATLVPFAGLLLLSGRGWSDVLGGRRMYLNDITVYLAATSHVRWRSTGRCRSGVGSARASAPQSWCRPRWPSRCALAVARAAHPGGGSLGCVRGRRLCARRHARWHGPASGPLRWRPGRGPDRACRGGQRRRPGRQLAGQRRRRWNRAAVERRPTGSPDYGARPGPGPAAAFTPDGRRLALAGHGPDIRVRAGDSGEVVVGTGHSGPVRAVGVAPHGAWLATAGADGPSVSPLPGPQTTSKAIGQLGPLTTVEPSATTLDQANRSGQPG